MFTQAEGTKDKGRILTEMKARALKVTLKVTLSNIIKLLRLVSDRSLFISGGGGVELCRDNQPGRPISL